MIHVTWCIVLASGKEESLSEGVETAFLSLSGKPVLCYSLEALEHCEDIDGVVVVVNKARMNDVVQMVKLYSCTKVRKIVAGTSQRLSSLKAGLKEVGDDATLIAVQEVSRPMLTPDLMSQTVKAGKRYGAALACSRIEDAVKVAERGQKTEATLDPGTAWAAQTPAVFRRECLAKALETGQKEKGPRMSDETALVESIGETLHMVSAPASNIRLRSVSDLALAEALLRF